MHTKKSIIAGLAILFTVTILISGCATTPRVPPSQHYATWQSQLPHGFKMQIELAQITEKAYHKITDTPIKELQTDLGAQQVGDLVTAARDKYRQWQSYGNYYVPFPHRSLWYTQGMKSYGFSVRFGNSVSYDSGTPGFKGSILEAVMDFGNSKASPSQIGRITSSRDRVIFAGAHRDERNWKVMEPFKDIMEGDRIADIPALIGRIKR